LSKAKNTGTDSISKVIKERKKSPSIDILFKGIVESDKVLLARAITLVESTKKEDHKKSQEIIARCLKVKTNSVRIGITGVPGVGKSTFIESFGRQIIAIGKKVAVLTVDPTSSISRGSILGDKTRMHELVKEEDAFIRPSPSGDTLGGVARATRESIILCEAAGFDVILIETVGVGQSETAVHSMVDFFLLLKLAGAGDELQGIKRGIMEMADAIVINKAEGANKLRAEQAKTAFQRAMQLYPPKENEWIPQVYTCSATAGTGIKEIWDLIVSYFKVNKGNGFFQIKRQEQNKYWLLQTVNELLKQDFYQNKKIKKHLNRMLNEVAANKKSPFSAAEELLGMQKNEPK
jgi:LAO/AO transport system kinase